MSSQFFLPDIVRPSLALAPGPSSRRPHRRNSWDGEPVATFGCRLRHLFDYLPTFRRVPFQATDFANPHIDSIVRNPDEFLAVPLPVAVVSKRYELIQHREAMRAVARALARRNIYPDDLPVDVTITEFGSRVHCSVQLPEEFNFVEPDGTCMALTIECFNSVDGSSSFRMLAGWFRFICSNGLIVGNSKLDFKRTHTPSLELGHVEWALGRALESATLERTRFEKWQRVVVPHERLVTWAESKVAKKWGVVAAARLLHIVRTGMDARCTCSRWRGPAHTRPMLSTVDVPGSKPPNDTVYKVAQILAWIAGQGCEVAARTEKRAQVTGMVRELAR